MCTAMGCFHILIKCKAHLAGNLRAQLKAGGQVDNRLKAAVETLVQHRKGTEWQRKTLLLRIALDRAGEVGTVKPPLSVLLSEHYSTFSG